MKIKGQKWKVVTINEMRKYISGQYDSLSWKQRVAGMPTNQVVAIYDSMKRREKNGSPYKKKEEYHQMDIWEWAYECNAAAGGKETHTEVRV